MSSLAPLSLHPRWGSALSSESFPAAPATPISPCHPQRLLSPGFSCLSLVTDKRIVPVLKHDHHLGPIDTVVRLIKAVGKWHVPEPLFQAAADLG